MLSVSKPFGASIASTGNDAGSNVKMASNRAFICRDARKRLGVAAFIAKSSSNLRPCKMRVVCLLRKQDVVRLNDTSDGEAAAAQRWLGVAVEWEKVTGNGGLLRAAPRGR